MLGRAREAPHRATGEQTIIRSPVSALVWRVFLLNGLVFVVGATALVLSPATVSAPVAVREVVVLAVGLGVILGVNAALVQASLRPLDGMTSLMERVDLLPSAAMPRAVPNSSLTAGNRVRCEYPFGLGS
ncbi:MAG TPA: hypothetical protein VNP92_03175 [Actinophytocola sp.]|nr:hypothetical protein [Actinophytocola sp.]